MFFRSSRRSKRPAHVSRKHRPETSHQPTRRYGAEMVEQLEPRRLLTTLTGGGGAFPNNFEFRDKEDNLIRISLRGNIVAEFIGLQVRDIEDEIFEDRLVDLVPAGAPDEIPGVDLFSIYIASADESASISIARFTENPEGEPMEPFGGSAGEFRVTNARTGRSVTVSPAGSSGAAFLGARTGDTIPNFDEEEDIAILSFPARQQFGVRPVTPKRKIDAGISTAPGVSIGKFFFGGTITGRVSIDGNVDTFYAGQIWTGDATGQLALNSPQFTRNFLVNGDLRNLITIGSIGTTELVDASSTNPRVITPDFKTGVDIRVVGRLGQILTKGDFLGAVVVEGNSAIEGSGAIQTEIEQRGPTPEGSVSFFEGLPFGATPELRGPSLGDNPIFNNDTQNTAQYLGTFDSDVQGQREIIDLRGTLNGDGGDPSDDHVDYYAVGLIAGQTIEVQLTALPIFGVLVPPEIHVGVFDPDGRQYTSDYNNNIQYANIGEAFRFTAPRPGIYKFAVGNVTDINFNSIHDERTVIGFPGGAHQYNLTIKRLANVAFGGLVASGSIGFTDSVGSNPTTGMLGSASIDVLNGDIGAIVSVADAGDDRSIFSTAQPITVRKGNLRAMEAPSIGTLDPFARNPVFGPDIHVPKGIVGLLRGTGSDVSFQVVSVNPNLADTGGNLLFPKVTVGLDYQLIDANAVFAGNLIAGRAVGSIRADEISTQDFPCRIAVNIDNRGNDGVIDLIDARSRLGTLTAGGPQITTGDGGNVRYINSPLGNTFRDRFFGSGSGDPTTFNPGQIVNLVDDNGTPVKITPLPQQRDQFGNLPNPGQITTLTYPIRDKGGQVIINIIVAPAPLVGDPTVGHPVTIESGVRGSTIGSAEIGRITMINQGTDYTFDEFSRTFAAVDPLTGPVQPNDITLSGVTTDVWRITSNAVIGGVDTGITSINNQTVAGEIVNVNAKHIGNLTADYVGIAKSSTKSVVEGVDILIDRAPNNPGASPFNQQRTLIRATGAGGPGFIINVNARRSVGNLHAQGTIGTVTANSDRTKAGTGEFEGINAPIWAEQTGGLSAQQGNIIRVNIGNGVLPSGAGDYFWSGIFADGVIDSIRNQGLGSDIRGAIVALRNTIDISLPADPATGTPARRTPFTGIGSIQLEGGSIIDANIMVVNDYLDAWESTPDIVFAPAPPGGTFASPRTSINEIELSGIGGIIGSIISADNIGQIAIDGGFGFITSELQQPGSSVFDGLVTDGFGVRNSRFDGGGDINFIVARGTGKRLSVTEYSASVRASERNQFDPFSQRLIASGNDLHRFFGTSKSAPKRVGKTEAGNVENTIITGSRQLGRLDAFRIVGADDVLDPLTGQPAMRISFGNRIQQLNVADTVHGLHLTAGGIDLMTTGNDIIKSSINSTGLIRTMNIGGSLHGSSGIRATGAEGRIQNLTLKRALFGTLSTAVTLDNLTVGTDFGSGNAGSSNRMGIVTVHGSFLTGAFLRVRKKLDTLNVGRDIQEGATIRAQSIGHQQIKGAVNGDIIIG